MKRIAPNNQLPATHFMVSYKHTVLGYYKNGSLMKIDLLDNYIKISKVHLRETIAIFRIRENKLPTKHKF